MVKLSKGKKKRKWQTVLVGGHKKTRDWQEGKGTEGVRRKAWKEPGQLRSRPGTGQKAQPTLWLELPGHPRVEMFSSSCQCALGAQTQGRAWKLERHSQKWHQMFPKVAWWLPDDRPGSREEGTRTLLPWWAVRWNEAHRSRMDFPGSHKICWNLEMVFHGILSSFLDAFCPPPERHHPGFVKNPLASVASLRQTEPCS